MGCGLGTNVRVNHCGYLDRAFVSDCRLYKNYEENSDEGCQGPSDDSMIVGVEEIIETASAPDPIPSPPPEAKAKATADQGDNAAIKR